MKSQTKRPKKNSARAEVHGFINIMTEEYFAAALLGNEQIEGKTFYVLRPLTHPRIIKMAADSLRKVAVR